MLIDEPVYVDIDEIVDEDPEEDPDEEPIVGPSDERRESPRSEPVGVRDVLVRSVGI